jgi:hypothetical protein
MTPEEFFVQAKQALNLPADTPLQSAYRFGADVVKDMPRLNLLKSALGVALDGVLKVCVTEDGVKNLNHGD